MQNATSVGKLARDAVAAVLQDDQHGFNSVLAQVAPTYGLNPFELDFSRTDGPQFFVGQYDIGALLDAGDLKIDPAIIVLYAGNRENNQGIRQKQVLFAGMVTVEVETHISWPRAHPVTSEPWIDLIDAVMFYMFNRTGLLWPNQVGYNADISVDPGVVQHGLGNWRALVRTHLSFSVRIP